MTLRTSPTIEQLIRRTDVRKTYALDLLHAAWLRCALPAYARVRPVVPVLLAQAVVWRERRRWWPHQPDTATM